MQHSRDRASGDELFSRARAWVANTYRSARIIAKGGIANSNMGYQVGVFDHGCDEDGNMEKPDSERSGNGKG